MIEKIRFTLSYLFITALLLFDAWGFYVERKITLYFFLFSPVVLFATYLFDKKKIEIPVRITAFFILFNIFVAISTIFAVHKQWAFEYQLYYLSISLLFIYFYNNAKEIKKIFFPYIIIVSILTFIYSLFLQFIIPSSLQFLYPHHTYQLVYKFPGYMNHYPIGAFALIPWSFLFAGFLFKKSILNTMGFIGVSIVILLSGLRSAYLGVLMVFGLIFILNKTFLDRKYLVSLLLFATIIILTSILVISQSSFYIPGISELHQYLVSEGAPFAFKTLVNARDNYFTQAITAIWHRPLYGYGSYNFHFVSLQFTNHIEFLTSNSHNILFDIATENGLIALTFFVGILILIGRSVITGCKEKEVLHISLSFVIIALFVLFQLNYYSRSYFLFFFLFLSAGLIYTEEKVIKNTEFLVVAAFLVAILGGVVLTANLFNQNGKYNTALQIYPLLESAHKAKINDLYRKSNHIELDQAIDKYISIYPENPESLAFAGGIYMKNRQFQEASYYYSQALVYSPQDPDIITSAYYSLQESESKTVADAMLLHHIQKYHILASNSEEVTLVKNLCEREHLPCSNF